MNISYNKMIKYFKISLAIILFFLVISFLFRLAFYLKFSNLQNIYLVDLAKAFFLGLRLDLTVIAYIQAPISLIFIILFLRKSFSILDRHKYILLYYFSFCFLVVSLIYISDFLFYSYFKERINLLYFGFFDDDTFALFKTFIANYNIFLIVILSLLYINFIYFSLKKIIYFKFTPSKYQANIFSISFSILFIILINFLSIRGTLAMYPLGKMIEDVSDKRFINILTINSLRALVDAYKIRTKNKANEYDIKEVLNINFTLKEAIKIHTNKAKIEEDFIKNITYKTPKNPLLKDFKPNVVLIIVESFGLPLSFHNSKDFNVLGSFNRHIKEDYLFTNFTSSANGTIGALESIVLGLAKRPKSSFFTNSKYLQSSFYFAPAFVYKSKNYETNFIYGGDLSWRNIGVFLPKQGFENVLSKANVLKFKKDSKDLLHDWGVFDEYLYEYSFERLKNSKKPSFTIILTTNNHPPYKTPNHYKKKITIPKELIINGDRKLAKKRFIDYSYAINSLGDFINKIKNDKILRANTIIAVTADNNTIAGISEYKKDKLLNSKRVPFYLYLPKKLRREMNLSVYGSQKDIMPSLYNLSLYDTKYISLGSNLLNNSQLHYGFNSDMLIFSPYAHISVKDKKHKTMVNYYKATLLLTQKLIQDYENHKF